MMYQQESSFARQHVLIGLLLILVSLAVVVACAQGAAGSSPTPTTQPSLPTITIKAMNYSFGQPQTVPVGLVDITFVNNGTEPHQDTIARLHDGVTFLQKPAGPPPFAFAGGLAAIAPQESAWLKLNLQPGQYGTLCFVTDPTTGKPHFMLGMLASFTVQ